MCNLPLEREINFQLSVLSSPEDFAGEQDIIQSMFELGLQRLNLRKPNHSLEQVRKWLLALPFSLHSKVVVHGHRDLLQEFNLAGFHGSSKFENLPSRSEKTNNFDEQISVVKTIRGVSLHCFEELEQGDWDYAFFSPIFPSLSKPGYMPRYTLEQIKEALDSWQSCGKKSHEKPQMVYALGGVEPGLLGVLYAAGFSGACVLGAIWNNSDPLRVWTRLRRERILLSRGHGEVV